MTDASRSLNALLEQPPSPPGVRHLEVTVDGVRLHVAERGPADGPPVILVHGWPQHWWCWREVAARLPEHRCLMPDLRGHGWSEAPPEGYEKARLAEDVRGVLDVLGVDSVFYVGHDWGAIAGFLLALDSPERISALLALSVPHPWPSRHDRFSPRRLAAGLYQLPISTPLLGPALMRRGLTKAVLRRASPPGTFSDTEAEVYDQRLASSVGGRITASLYRTFLLRELPALWRGERRRLEVEARLLIGEHDPIGRGADLRGHEWHAPRMNVERISGAGHFLPEERPELVARHVRELWERARQD